MRGKASRLVIVACLMLALSLVFAASAFASTHTTELDAVGNASLTATLTSVGDNGVFHNSNGGMSPIAPDPGPDFTMWFNKPVTMSDLFIADSVDADDDITLMGGFWQLSTDGTTWGSPSMFTSATLPATVNLEGLYSVTATGDDVGDGPATGTVQPFFGIDTHSPSSKTDLPATPAGDPDAVPVFNVSANVTISATDTLSGVERMTYSSDTVKDFATIADLGTDDLATVPFNTPGTKSLTWHVYDNAGNLTHHTVSLIVRPAGFHPVVHLAVSQSGTGKRTIRLLGEVGALATDSNLHFTVQRRSGGAWVSYTTYDKTLGKFWDDFSVTHTVGRAGTFRVKVTLAGGSSDWHSFTTK